MGCQEASFQASDLGSWLSWSTCSQASIRGTSGSYRTLVGAEIGQAVHLVTSWRHVDENFA